MAVIDGAWQTGMSVKYGARSWCRHCGADPDAEHNDGCIVLDAKAVLRE
jgi:hypothetical protein